MARVLVTGATGFIGRHLVRHLVKRGDRVRCLIHEKEARVADAECFPGDITLPVTLDRAIREVDVVYHLAGATVVASPHRYKAVNSLGTRHLGEACARLANPPVLVFLSSLAAAGPTIPDQPRREEDAPVPVSEYGRSKLQAEHYLRQVAGRLPITVLRPPGVFGPGDTNLLTLFKIARWGVNFIPGSVDQQLSFIYVDDLVEALPYAAEQGERLLDQGSGLDHARGIYFVAMEERCSLEGLGGLAANAMGRDAVRPLVIPAWVGKIVTRTNDFLARLTMQPMLLTSDKMSEALAGSWICSSASARRAWGFTCRTRLAEGFQKTVRWYRQQGWL
jgi:dihydroflavonol-4-reductase